MDATDKIEGFTPLMLAAFCGHTEVAQELIRNGANAEHKRKEGIFGYHTALTLAIAEGHADTARALVRSGARVDDAELMRGAIEEHWSPVVAGLCELGAPVDKVVSSTLTPLVLAAEVGYLDIIQILLQHGAKVMIFLYTYIFVLF